MSCFWGCSKKLCIGVNHLNAQWVSYQRDRDERGDWIPSTNATFRCVKCGSISTKLLYGAGSLSIEQINGDGA